MLNWRYIGVPYSKDNFYSQKKDVECVKTVDINICIMAAKVHFCSSYSDYPRINWERSNKRSKNNYPTKG